MGVLNSQEPILMSQVPLKNLT
ncbi:hypothetical protein RDABS01_021419 [Bienertia sinuspersici]